MKFNLTDQLNWHIDGLTKNELGPTSATACFHIPVNVWEKKHIESLEVCPMFHDGFQCFKIESEISKKGLLIS